MDGNQKAKAALGPGEHELEVLYEFAAGEYAAAVGAELDAMELVC